MSRATQAEKIIVREFPDLLDAAECRRFFRDLRSVLADSHRPQVVFDLSRVQHMTAEGVDLLVRCVHQIADRDGELKLAAASPQTQLVLELTQISGVAESYDSVEEATETWTARSQTPWLRQEAIVPELA